MSSARYGHSIERLDSTGSTNDDARSRAEAGADDGHVVVALQQSSGRGSHGRSWSSPEGGLYFSVVVRPKLSPAALPPLTLAAGLAVAEASETLAPSAGPLLVKWPNDVLLGGRKCAGILAESATVGGRLDFAIVGIGINVGRTSFDGDLTAVAASLPEIDHELLLAEVLLRLEHWVDRLVSFGPAPLVAALDKRLAHRDETMRCGDVVGRVVGLAESGALRIETDDGVHEVFAGRLEAP